MRIELGKSFRNIERHRKELQHLSERIVLVQEEERNKLSRELHDHTGQALIALKTNLEVIDKLLPENVHESREWLKDSKQFLVKTLEEIRNLSYSLRPPMLDELGLVPTIESYSKDFSAMTKIAVNIKSNLKTKSFDQIWSYPCTEWYRKPLQTWLSIPGQRLFRLIFAMKIQN
jgi:signal transduction histidine kinase